MSISSIISFPVFHRNYFHALIIWVKRGEHVTETVLRLACCVLFVIASVSDERERKIPRLISYLECLCACACWCVEFYVNRQFVFGNLIVSISLFALLFFFYLKGNLGRGDLYLVFSMFVLLSQGQSTRALIWEENMLLCVSFFSASVRLLFRRFKRRRTSQPGCPFAVHLLLGYLVVAISSAWTR